MIFMDEIKFRFITKPFKTIHYHMHSLKELLVDLPMEYETILSIDMFTGLKDKHGGSIYEGDILQMGEYRKYSGVIVFDQGSFCFKGGTGGLIPLRNIKEMIEEMAIIGNIHENPELLWGTNETKI